METDAEPERIDFSAVDPAADPERWERLVGGVLLRAAPELERRAATGPLIWVARWAMPTLPLAAAVAALALAGLASAEHADATLPLTAPVVQALGPPEPPYSWLAEARSPAASDLIRAIQEAP
jgi:hypothetical protein